MVTLPSMTVVYAAVAVACGTGLGYGRGALARPLAFATVVLFTVAWVTWKRPGVAPAAIVVITLATLACASGASASWRTLGEASGLLPDLARRKFVVEACGVVQGKRPKSLEIRADRVELAESAWRTNEPLRISGRAAQSLRPGERLCAKGSLVPPRPGFDEAPLLVADRIGERSTGSVLRMAAAIVRERFAEAAERSLPRTQAGLLLGMTDGDTALIDDATVEDFRTTGLAHIVAVSGYNVAVFLGIVMLFARALVPRGRWLRVAIAVPTLVFFVFLTGLEPSVMRATLSAGVALTVSAGGRQTDALRAVAFAFVLLLLAAPQLLFDIGFQLSFGATLGIILLGEPLSHQIARLMRKDTRFAKAVASGFGTTIAAQVAVAPLLAWHFGRIPGFGALANVIAIPLGGVVMLGGIATLGAASLVSFLDWAPATMRLPLDAILWSAHAFARVPAASIAVSALAASAMAGSVVAFIVRSQRTRAGAIAFVVLCTGAAVGQARAGSTCRAPSVVALDVGQGTAILLRASGHAVLVDGGPAAGRVVQDLEKLDVRELDAVFISHPHADHTEGIVDVLKRIAVKRLIGPATLPWGVGADVVKGARDRDVPLSSTGTGDTFDFGDALQIEVLSPESGPPPPYDESLVNRYSLVLRARVGDVEVLLPGDVAAEDQRRLLDAELQAPVLIAPHHGSKDIDEGFVAGVSPLLTLVTVGAANRYGHPTSEAIRTYARTGRVLRTDRSGTIELCFGADGAEVTTER